MITKDKVTEIFCIIDEFDKNLDDELKKNLRLPNQDSNRKRYRNRKGKFPESEVMTILYAIISVPIAILRSIMRIVSAVVSTKSSPMRYPIIAL